MNIYYISDIHFSHKEIIDFCNRPYENIQDMNEDIIRRWNSVVTPNDVVRIVGDIAMPKTKEDIQNVIQLVKRLNGNKTLIIGNHDYKLIKNKDFVKLFSSVENYMVTKDNGRKVVLFHYPTEEWEGFFKGYIHVHGHLHDKDESIRVIKNRYNASADILDLTPRTLDELIEINIDRQKCRLIE